MIQFILIELSEGEVVIKSKGQKIPSYLVINLGSNNFLRVHTSQRIDKNIDCCWKIGYIGALYDRTCPDKKGNVGLDGPLVIKHFHPASYRTIRLPRSLLPSSITREIMNGEQITSTEKEMRGRIVRSSPISKSKLPKAQEQFVRVV